jgi:hypothetical protein
MSIFGPLADLFSVESVLVASGILAIGVTLVAGRGAPVALAPDRSAPNRAEPVGPAQPASGEDRG